MGEPTEEGTRLAELVTVLSLGTDLGLGQPMEHMLRQSQISLRLGERLGLDTGELATVYYTALLAWVGCHVDAHEQAKWFGDDLTLKGELRLVDTDTLRADLRFMLGHLGPGRSPLERIRLGVTFLAGGYREADVMFENHWMATKSIVTTLGLHDVCPSLEHTFERWDGRGMLGVRGEEMTVAARLCCLSDVMEIVHRLGGVDAAVEVARARSGTQFDPDLVTLLAAHADDLFDDLDAAGTWEHVVDTEPGPPRIVDDEALDVALEAIADFVDLKCPMRMGHSRAVGDLAGDAALAAGLDPAASRRIRHAGLLHDLGQLGVPNSVWDKATMLTRAERERIRLHPYFTDRMLSSSTTLAPVAAAASQHHERLDGSGYPRGLTADTLGSASRIVAAADVYQALVADRPHRPAREAAEAATVLRDEVTRGHLDADAVGAVLQAAGHRSARPRARTALLTPRETEVLRLVARGLTDRQIAEHLVISRKTAGNHVEHIYAKTGVRNRAQASVYAVTHGLV